MLVVVRSGVHEFSREKDAKKDKGKGTKDKQEEPNYRFGLCDLAFVFLTMLTKIPLSSPVSFLMAATPSAAQKPDSLNSSNQYSLSSNSCNDPSILLMKSRLDLARVASRYYAPTEVPDLSNCRPMTWTSVLFGSSAKSRITESA